MKLATAATLAGAAALAAVAPAEAGVSIGVGLPGIGVGVGVGAPGPAYGPGRCANPRFRYNHPGFCSGPGYGPPPAIGVFVSGRGYWDGHGWYQHRFWGNGAWHYR